MPHTGLEAKPTWQSVPLPVRRLTETTLGDRVSRASRVWGGYSPTPTFRLVLAGGRRAFFKGMDRHTNPFATKAFINELKSYEGLGKLASAWMPEFYGHFQYEDWMVMLLEDLGPKSVPPWTPIKTRQVCAGLADLHLATRDKEFPAWLPHLRERLPEFSWPRVLEDSRGFETIAATCGDKGQQAIAWLEAHYPLFVSLTENLAELGGPPVLLHGDVRSDNLRLVNGGLRLFDWPYATIGTAEWDLVEFAQTVQVEGGALPEQIVEWYGQSYPVNHDALLGHLAWFGAFFATLYWREEIPGLPRLRKFQRDQLRVLLYWLSRQLSLSPPDWL